jgi:hypothetical protein
LAIARCLDRDPTIAAQVVEFAQSLVEQQKAPHTATNSCRAAPTTTQSTRSNSNARQLHKTCQ